MSPESPNWGTFKNAASTNCNYIAQTQRRSQKLAKGGHGARGGPLFPMRGAPLMSIGAPVGHMGACSERGAHLRHLGASLMPMTYGGAHVQKRGALWKPWGASIVVTWNCIVFVGLGLSERSWYWGKYGKARLLALHFCFSCSICKRESMIPVVAPFF